MRIESDAEYQEALQRLNHLAEDPHGPAKDEFFEINTAMVEYETRNHPEKELKMPEIRKAIVRCQDDYERATERVAEVGTPPPGSEEEAELIGLIEAIEKWDARHDDVTGWE